MTCGATGGLGVVLEVTPQGSDPIFGGNAAPGGLRQALPSPAAKKEQKTPQTTIVWQDTTRGSCR